jgi:ferredoxin
VQVKIEVDPETCIGNGMCCALAPAFFELNFEGELTILKDDPADAHRAEVEDAAASCPVGAIKIES